MNSTKNRNSTESVNVISLGIKHNGGELIRIRCEYPSVSECPLLEKIAKAAFEFARTRLKDYILKLPDYRPGVRAKYSLTVTAEPISDDVLDITLSAELRINSKNIPPITNRRTYLYSTAQKRFVPPEHLLPQLVNITDKRGSRRLVSYLKHKGAWHIRHGELFLDDKSKGESIPLRAAEPISHS